MCGKKLNFLYDFSRDLDTGGRNWDCLYRHFDPKCLHFASDENVNLKLPSVESRRSVQIIDGGWLHIGGISYNDNFRNKFDFFKGLRQAFEEGGSLADLCAGDDA